MSEEHEVSFSLEVLVGEKGATAVRNLQAAVYKTLGLFRRLGLPEPIDSAITKIQRFIAIANQARLTVIALNAAMATTPFGWILFGVSAATLVLDAGDFIMDLG